jgi:hypothetical protein
MNKLSTEEKVRVVACLVEGNSLRARVRMTGIHRTTIQNLLVELAMPALFIRTRFSAT